MGRGIRNNNWNYGGRNWKLSRSKIDLFIECPRCFYLDNKLGVRRPSMPSFNINSAVDSLLKKEFDVHRSAQTPHPLFKQFEIEAVPFQHKKMDTWRENFEGVIVNHAPSGLVVSGAIDDLWQLSDGSVAVVDYKSTAKDKLDMTTKWIQNYYRQLEIYQWLLANSGVNISTKGYILYANGDLSADSFAGQIKFKMSLHEHIGNTDWIDPLLVDIKSTLESDEIPASHEDCEHCEYDEMRQKVSAQDQNKVVTTSKVESKVGTPVVDTDSSQSTKTLFD